MDSAKLIELLKNKDEKAIAFLYDKYASSLYGIIFRIVNSHEQAESLLEDAYINIIEQISAYKDHATLFTWMVSLTRTMAQQYILQNELPEIGSVSPAITYDLLTENGCPELFRGMDSQCEKVLLHVYFQNHSILQTSLALNIPLNEVKVLLRSALYYISYKMNPPAKLSVVA